MSGYLINAQIRVNKIGERMKQFLHDFIHEEKGAAEIIAVIILVVIVLLLAVAFREKIGAIVSNLWKAMDGKVDKTVEDFK